MKTKNPYLVKKTIQTEKIILESKEIEVIDWDNVPEGTYMVGEIQGVETNGVLAKDGPFLYFCQNLKDGDNAPFKFGFKYSWSFNQHQDGTLTCGVSNIEFPPKPKDFLLPTPPPKPPTIKVGSYDALIYTDYIKVGCQTISKETILEVLKTMETITNNK
jgi:hypothetical protein